MQFPNILKEQRFGDDAWRQHAADFRRLKTAADFEHLRSKEKRIDCICVDGVTDERPSVKEVHFLWTKVH